MLYEILKRYIGIMIRTFYRKLEIVGRENIPVDGPVLLIGNHPNSLIDPFMAGIASPRRVSFTAKSTLAKMPFLGPLANKMGVIFLHRRQDLEHGASPRKNILALAQIVDVLGEDGVVCIFPEGRCHDEPGLARFKTGAARIAWMHAETSPDRELRIVPFGLSFEEAARPRSKAAIHIGQALTLESFLDSNPNAGPRDFTNLLHEKVMELTPSFRSEDERSAFPIVAELGIDPEIDGHSETQSSTNSVIPQQTDSKPASNASLFRRNHIVHKLIRGRTWLESRNPRSLGEALGKTERIQDLLDAMQMSAHQWILAGARPSIASTLFLVFLLPITIWGAIHMLIPIQLVRHRLNRSTENHLEVATRWVAYLSLISIPIWIAYQGLAAILISPSSVASFGLWIAYGLSIPIAVWIAIKSLDRWRDLSVAMRSRRRLRNHEESHRRLQTMRAELQADLSTLWKSYEQEEISSRVA